MLSNLTAGAYLRPVTDVSGVANTSALYRRSPCPALNTLANHRFLPRNGQNVTHNALRNAMTSVFNLDESAIQVLLALVPPAFSLDLLGTHNFIEHDASLVHSDALFGEDPAVASSSLVKEFLSHAVATTNPHSIPVIGVRQLAAIRRDRAELCASENPECTFSEAKPQSLAFIDASILLLGMGGDSSSEGGEESLRVDHAYAFLMDERIPEDFVKAASPITVQQVQATSAKVRAAMDTGDVVEAGVQC